MTKRIEFKSGRRNRNLAEVRFYTLFSIIAGVIITIYALAVFAGYFQLTMTIQ